MKQLINNNDYHNHEAIGSTLLKSISKKSVWHALMQPFKKSDAMALGSAVHALVLEPETFQNEFAVNTLKKESMLSTSDDIKAELKKIGLPVSGKKADLIKRLIDSNPIYKERIYDLALIKFEKESEGKILLDSEQSEKAPQIVKSIMNHEIAKAMLSNGEAEYSYIVTDEETGLELKCRPDYLNQNALIDLKTCADASNEGFMKACINFGYHLQAAFYLDVYNKSQGTQLNEFYFVAVETTAPFAVNVFKMGEVEINMGRELYKNALSQYALFLKSGPDTISKFGYKEKINEIQFPIWALNNAELKLEA